jgi:hypothetical protein
MKKLLMLAISFISVTTFAQPWENLKGNGNLKKEVRTVDPFTSLASSGAFDVEISYGNSDKITLQMDENLLPYIETRVEDGKLSIKTKNKINIRSASKMVVYVSMKKITGLYQSGSGDISGEGAFTNNSKTDIKLSGSGNIKLAFDSFEDLDISLSGSGNINLNRGKTGTISTQLSGSGNIDCSNILSEEVVAAISGSGNVKINASKSIEAKISGSGNVFYKGSAANIKSKIAGSGKLVKI